MSPHSIRPARLVCALTLFAFLCCAPATLPIQAPKGVTVVGVDADGNGIVERYVLSGFGRPLCEFDDEDQDGRVDLWTHHDPQAGVSAHKRLADEPGWQEMEGAGGTPLCGLRDDDQDRALDTWTYFEEGYERVIVRDTNHDRKPDHWELFYGTGQGIDSRSMTSTFYRW